MNKQKTILIIITALMAVGSYFMYTSSIIYWDAYAYEVSTTETVEPEFTITVTNEELAAYPDLAAFLEGVGQDGVYVDLRGRRCNVPV